MENPDWLEHIVSGQYKNYYKQMYSDINIFADKKFKIREGIYMDYSMNKLKKVMDVYNRLADEKSKTYFRASTIFNLYGLEEYYKSVEEVDRDIDFGRDELMDIPYFKNPNYRGIVLFGNGYFCTHYYYQLKKLGYKIIAVCDNNKALHGKSNFGLDIISLKN